jgi:hypothetical protein
MGVKDDLKKLRGIVRGWISTEEGYRGVVAGVLFSVGYFGLIGPLETRLEEARIKHAEVSKVAEMVDQIDHYEEQTLVYQDRLIAADSSAAWGDYVLGMMDISQVIFKSFSEKKSESYTNFEVLGFEVGVVGEYDQLVDFMDRLERGSRYLRIDEFKIGVGQETLLLNCTVRCLAGMTEAQRLDQIMRESFSPSIDSDVEEAQADEIDQQVHAAESESLAQGGA